MQGWRGGGRLGLAHDDDGRILVVNASQLTDLIKLDAKPCKLYSMLISVCSFMKAQSAILL